jgi:hypothetical protein
MSVNQIIYTGVNPAFNSGKFQRQTHGARKLVKNDFIKGSNRKIRLNRYKSVIYNNKWHLYDWRLISDRALGSDTTRETRDVDCRSIVDLHILRSDV